VTDAIPVCCVQSAIAISTVDSAIPTRHPEGPQFRMALFKLTLTLTPTLLTLTLYLRESFRMAVQHPTMRYLLAVYEYPRVQSVTWIGLGLSLGSFCGLLLDCYRGRGSEVISAMIIFTRIVLTIF